MRVITFSRFFPGYHPRKGEPTYFVQKVLHSLIAPAYKPLTGIGNPPKYHTIRVGNKWKVGDKFSARYWGDDINPKSGKSGPYQSKQIEFAQLEVKRVWNIKVIRENGEFYILYRRSPVMWDHLPVEDVAKNDGLSVEELDNWFNKIPYEGLDCQIICWNPGIDY